MSLFRDILIKCCCNVCMKSEVFKIALLSDHMVILSKKGGHIF